MARYAEGTTVSVDKSRGEISGILTSHGILRQGWWSEPEGDGVQFEYNGGVYRLNIPRPTAVTMEKQDSGKYRYPYNIDWADKAEKEWKRRWRATVLLLKVKLEFAEDGDVTSLERELLPYRLLTDGTTLEHAILGDGTGLQLLPAKAG